MLIANPYFQLAGRIGKVQNSALAANYQALLKSVDYRMKRAWETQYACCDAYHLRNQPENIRCCVLGSRYGMAASV